MATPDRQGQSPKPPRIPPPGSLPKLPQTLFFLETDDEKPSAPKRAKSKES